MLRRDLASLNPRLTRAEVRVQGLARIAEVQRSRSKAELDEKFDGELKRFDPDAIWTKKEIPGYR